MRTGTVRPHPQLTAAGTSDAGWGGRDRTYECRNQNPVPYHLATPQTLLRQPMQRMTLQAARHEPAHGLRKLRSRRVRLGFSGKFGIYAGAGTAHARLAMLLQPGQMARYFRIAFAHHGLEIVAQGALFQPCLLY